MKLDSRTLDAPQPTVSLPVDFGIWSVAPNPFNSNASITYGVAFPTHLTLTLYDLSGRKMATLIDRGMRPGTYNAVLSSGELTSGMYLLRLESMREVSTRKVVLLR